MRKNGLIQRLKTRAGILLLLSGVGTMLVSSVNAEDRFSDEVFADAGTQLSVAVAALDNACSEAKPDCAAPAADKCNGNGGCNGDAGCCDDACDWCCLGEPYKLLGTTCKGVELGGWVSMGYSSEGNGLFNNHPNRFNMNQMNLYAEKVADGSCGLDWGFRADLMYGVDAQDTQSFGNNPGNFDYLNGLDHGIYGWAVPQLYVEFASGDWSIIGGHFYTIAGYEVVTAPDNFFYSHALTMYNSEPFTHTGVLATYNASDNLEVYAGWTAGWDTGFDQLGGGSNFLGGASLSISDDASVTYILAVGNMGEDNLGGRGDGYTHSIVLDVALSDSLNYVLQSDLVSLSTGAGGHNDEVGLNQYLIYTVNDCIGVGARLEWWKSDGGFNYGGRSTPPAGTQSYYDATFGVNVRPHANLVIRPEVRVDWNPASDYEETGFGVDAIWTF